MPGTMRSILIVEDEPLIAMMLEDFLETLGHRSSPAATVVDEALGHVEAGGFEVAILDVSLKDGQQVWPVADRLAAAGTPFILATGGHVEPPPAAHAGAPVLVQALYDRRDRARAGPRLRRLSAPAMTKRQAPDAWSLLSIPVFLYLASCAVLFFAQTALIFPVGQVAPPARCRRAPSALDLAARLGRAAARRPHPARPPGRERAR